MFHISDLKKFERCPKMFQLSLTQEKKPFNPYVRMDEEITPLAMKKLQVEDYFLGMRNDDAQKSLEAMKTFDWIVKGRFEAKGLRIKVPFLHRQNDGWDCIFVFNGILPKCDDTTFYTAVLWVLKENKIKINEISLLHLNGNYVRHGELDEQELFIQTKQFYNDSGNPSKYIEEWLQTQMRDYTDILAEMKRIAESAPLEAKKIKMCTRKGKCEFYDTCFPHEADTLDDSIMTLVSSQYKAQMKSEGIRQLKEIDLSRCEGTRQQYAQIMASKNEGVFVDKYALENWLSRVKPQVSFLDFEWETYAIPKYDGLRPFQVVPFQFSLHYFDEQGEIQHREFIGIQDCRKQLVEALLAAIPKEGTIFAYNAEGAEKLRIKEFAEQFSEYHDELMRIHDRLLDLSDPFIHGFVYDIRMQGIYSLKKLTEVFTDLTYHDLDIAQGMQAVFEWRHLDKEETDSPELIRHLLEYCGMDSLSMIQIYQWLCAQREK